MELTLDLDEDVHAALARRADEHEFESTAAYCETVLELVVDELESDDHDDAVEQRLEDLGYLS